MSAWSRLAETLGDDDDDELDSFVGQQVPNSREPPYSTNDRVPRGAKPDGRIFRLYDGTRGKAWYRRPDGMYDVTVYTPGLGLYQNDDRVLHPSEFRWED